MGVVKKMTAWVLIGIFQVFLIHQALCHQHHSHDHSSELLASIPEIHHDHHHGPDHSHHHQHSKKSETTDHDSEHSLTNNINHRLVHTTNNGQNQQAKDIVGFSSGIGDSAEYSFLRENLLLSYHCYSPVISHGVFHSAVSLRGPPAIV